MWVEGGRGGGRWINRSIARQLLASFPGYRSRKGEESLVTLGWGASRTKYPSKVGKRQMAGV